MNVFRMIRRPDGPFRTLMLSLVLVLIVSLVPAASVAGSVPSAMTATLPAQPQVVSESQSDAFVALVIQVRGMPDSLAAEIVALGGRVVHRLPMLNALAVEVPADSVATLSANPAIARMALDAPIVPSAAEMAVSDLLIDAKKNKPADPTNTFLATLGVQNVWNMGLQGQGIGVAVIDSGIAHDSEFGNRLVVRLGFHTEGAGENLEDLLVTAPSKVSDDYGHGTHVAGIIGAEGKKAGGAYVGIAPKVNLISLKIMDDSGAGRSSDALAAAQWILDNKNLYNIRVVNLSVNSADDSYYRESLLNAAVELLWFNGIVVVASAGNNTAEVQAAPANDPFIITVGASLENPDQDAQPGNRSNDVVANFTATGTLTYSVSFTDTLNNTVYTDTFQYAKPDIIAPGKNIVSVLAPTSKWKQEHPARVVANNAYFKLSGTSMAAPMVTGAVALLLQDEPGLTPDQVKCRLRDTATGIGYAPGSNQFAYLNVAEAVNPAPQTVLSICADGENPNFLVPINLWLEQAVLHGGVNWNSVNWNSVNWNSVNWNSVDWSSVNWNSVNWNSVNWNSVNWNSVNWNSVNWNSVNWNSVNWNSVNWNSVNWNSVNWNSVNWNSVSWVD